MYWTIDFPLLTLEYYWTTIFKLSVSTFMSHIIFGMPTWYISVLFLYLCANVFIWCHCCFICLKLWKKWIYFVFLNICCGLPIFSADVAEKMFSGPLPIFCRCRCFLLWHVSRLERLADLVWLIQFSSTSKEHSPSAFHQQTLRFKGFPTLEALFLSLFPTR